MTPTQTLRATSDDAERIAAIEAREQLARYEAQDGQPY